MYRILVVAALAMRIEVAMAQESAPPAEPKWDFLIPRAPSAADSIRTRQVGPNRPCDWRYVGLEAFANAARNRGFDPRFNPFITVSRRGLTARVVGTLTPEFIAKHGGDLRSVVARFPWLTPVRQTAVHTARAEDAGVAAKHREPRGEILTTEVRSLPANSVMIVYPVAVANRARGANTLAGNWRITYKNPRKQSSSIGGFGRFPFLLYTGSNGHAFHGPITDDELRQTWVLQRGEVSHGCNRMEGEHVLELSVLLGCTGAIGAPRCPAPGPAGRDQEFVTVMEEFDHIPDPGETVPEGASASWSDIHARWIGVDVDYPRFASILERQRREGLVTTVGDHDEFRLRATTITKRGPAPDGPAGAVRRVVFPTWDNRARKLVSGENCR